jgi:hypothetical protein
VTPTLKRRPMLAYRGVLDRPGAVDAVIESLLILAT